MTFPRTEADFRQVAAIWRKQIDGKKYLLARDMMDREVCRVEVPGKPDALWRGPATRNERTLVVRWIIRNIPRAEEIL